MSGVNKSSTSIGSRQRSQPRLLIFSLLAFLAVIAGGSATLTVNASGTVAYGVLSCFTGTLASLGQAMLQGSQVAQKEINAAGGILGKKLTLQHADTQCDEADAVPAVHQLLAVNNLAGIIGPETQEIAAVAPILTHAKIPDEFQGGSTLFDRNTNPYLWRDSPSDSQLGVAMALYAHNKGYKKAALLFYSDIAAQTFIKPITATWKKLGGTIVSNITLAPDQSSYQSQVQQVIAAKPDVIFTQTDTATAAVLYQNFQELNNLAIPFVGTDVTGGSEYLHAITIPVAHAHLTSVYGTSVSGKATTEFNKEFASINGKKAIPLANANYAYDSVISLALAEDEANSTAGPKVIKAMKKVTNPPGTQCYTYSACYSLIKAGKKINFQGASGNLDYNKYNNTFGPYGAFQVNLSGNEHQVMLLSASALAKATP